LSTKCLLLITKRLSKELNIHQKTIQKEDTNCSQGYQYNIPTASNMSIVFWIYIYGLRNCIKKSLGKRVMRNLAIVGPLQNKTWQQTHIMLVKMTFWSQYTMVTLQYSALSLHNNDHHASKWWTLWFSLSCWVQVTYCCFSSQRRNLQMHIPFIVPMSSMNKWSASIIPICECLFRIVNSHSYIPSKLSTMKRWLCFCRAQCVRVLNKNLQYPSRLV
jgi:hypothetical protein